MSDHTAHERVVVINNKINMNKFGWKPDLPSILLEMEF